MDKGQYKRILREGDCNILHEEFKGVEWADRELERIKKIIDLEEQVKEAEKIWKICDNVYYLVSNPPPEVNVNEPYGFNHFKELCEEFRDLKNKSSTSKPDSKNCSHCSKEIVSNPINQEFCSKTCSLFVEIKNLISKNYSNANSNDLYQLAQKLLELAQEYSNSLNSNLKPYCDSLIENLHKLTDDSYEAWNSSAKLQNLLDYCQEKEKLIGSAGLGLLKGATYYLYPGTGYCFWNGYDWGKKTIKKRIEELESSSDKQGNSKCYEERCNKCFGKFSTTYQWENNPYCSTCYQLARQEKFEQDWNPVIYCRYCSAKSELFDVCDKQECLAKMNQEIESKKSNNTNSNSIINNSHIRERERKRERERERERETNFTQQSQLLSEIMNLEQNPNPNSQELDSKKQQLKILETKSKELIKPLPLDTQITILQKEIKALTSKSTKTKAEESILASKKQELEELLKKQNKPNATETNPSNRTALYIGLGIIGILVVLGLFIFIRKHRKRPIKA